MNVQTYDFYRQLIGCIVIFILGIATATQGQQQDTNDATPLIADVNQLKDKVKTQEDIILRANSRISELERQLAEQTKQNNRLQLLCEKAGIKITAEPDGNSSPNIPESKKMELKSRAEQIETVRIKIQKMYDAIELDKTRIITINLPSGDIRDHDAMAKTLDNATERCRLYHNIEGNYKDITQLAKVYPELGINVMAMEKKLILCQRDRQSAESSRDYWQKQLANPKMRPRNMNIQQE
jgi:hypothetical protein